ncbi:hypothetical protein TNCV_4208861 [Trichonephila clavipes]|nr:hypothetical protein TNCV_4208861 [Trichonephila clavipes]
MPGFDARCHHIPSEYTRSTCSEGIWWSAGLKVLWVVTAKTTSAGGWRIFPYPPVPCLNCGDIGRHAEVPGSFYIKEHRESVDYADPGFNCELKSLLLISFTPVLIFSTPW